ncbi:restriction endonuclease subunit S [Elizabethkingia anophelis]|nr:restriction endonuclease subunit S [Elizabethkingia anophelis]
MMIFKRFRVRNLVDDSIYYPIGDGDHGSIKPEMYQEDGIPYIRVQNLNWNGQISLKGMVFISDDVNNANAKSILKPNDILIAKTGATIGKLGLITDEIGIANTTSSVGKVTVDSSRFSSKYILYCFQTKNFNDQLWLEASQKSAQPGFNIDDLVDFEISAPEKLEDQISIVEYLDKKTTEIDTIIAKKEKLLELLEEKKKAIINEAVTKGLTPNAKMKDSGIEWIGDIPKHWKMKPLGFLGSCQNGVSKGSDYFGEGFPFVNYGDIYKNHVLPEYVEGLAKSTDEDREIYSVLKGDVFFTRTSETIEEIGIASTCLRTIENAVFSGFTIRFRPNNSSELFPAFSKYFFRSNYVRVSLVKEMNLVTRASLSQTLLKSLKVLLPPIEEQENISIKLDKIFNNIDLSKGKISLQIEKLKEYRQSLISEAVTGKLNI